jgi:hypothetical protein
MLRAAPVNAVTFLGWVGWKENSMWMSE